MLSNDLVGMHCLHLDMGYEAFHKNDFLTALTEFDMALAIEERPMARWDRALTLLALGRWREGFQDWRTNWQIHRAELTPLGTKLYFDQHRPRWRGELGARVIILAEAGFGDQLQMLRFVSLARERADIKLDLPAPMQRLGKQLAPLAVDGDECDFVCPMFDMMPALGIDHIPPPPYLKADPFPRTGLAARWWRRPVIGICWSTKFEGDTEHPSARRPIPLDEFLARLNPPSDCELVSLQTQERKEAMDRGINAPNYSDFADVAATVLQCDAICSIDSAAVHCAAACGHPACNVLLPFASTWRWQSGSSQSAHSAWYPAVNLCKQSAPGDWPSAFANVRLCPDA